ncbi:MAG: hypothetical protein AAGJ18_16155 [Bacteroidota bacterium]
MNKKIKKYSFDNVEQLSGVEFKYAMAATSLLILMIWGIISAEGSPFGEFSLTILSVFSWWAFRQYFVKVGDKRTALVLLVLILTLALAGLANIAFSVVFDLNFMINVGSPHSILDFFKFMAWLLIFAGVVVFIGCFRIIWVNRQHSFPLKRIAISAAIGIPLYLLINALSTISFIGQAATILNDIDNAMHEAPVYTDGVDLYQDFWEVSRANDRKAVKDMIGGIFGIFSFLLSPFVFAYKLLIVAPYIFLLFHFYKADKANERKEVMY